MNPNLNPSYLVPSVSITGYAQSIFNQNVFSPVITIVLEFLSWVNSLPSWLQSSLTLIFYTALAGAVLGFTSLGFKVIGKVAGGV